MSSTVVNVNLLVENVTLLNSGTMISVNVSVNSM